MRWWRRIAVHVYTLVSVVGTSLFLGFGIRETHDMSELHSLSHLITATPALEAAFFWFMLLHGLLGSVVYAALISHPCWAMFFAAWITTTQTLTGAFNTTDYSDWHYAYAVLAFTSTLAAGITALYFDGPMITRRRWRRILAWALVGISAALLVSFGIVVQLSCCTWEGPFEWTSMILISFIPLTVFKDDKPLANQLQAWT